MRARPTQLFDAPFGAGHHVRDLRVGRQIVRVVVFPTAGHMRRFSSRLNGEPYGRDVIACVHAIARFVNGRRTGHVAMLLLHPGDIGITTIAHEAVHVAMRVLARRGVPAVATTRPGRPRGHEERLATLVGQIAREVFRALDAAGYYRRRRRRP